MGIGYRIKEAREKMGLTQIELGNMVGVTGSAITNYEKGTSHPKEQIIYKLMETLNIDANYLFQDVVHLPQKESNITLAEYEHIKKYRVLDAHGKKMVDFTLQEEWERSVSEDKIVEISSAPPKDTDHLTVQAAHARTDIEHTPEGKAHDDAIINDDSEWK